MTQSRISGPKRLTFATLAAGQPKQSAQNFAKPGAADNQTPPTNTFVAAIAHGATPKYGSQQGFRRQRRKRTDSIDLSEEQRQKLKRKLPRRRHQASRCRKRLSIPLPTTEFVVPPAAPAQPERRREVYPRKAANRPGSNCAAILATASQQSAGGSLPVTGFKPARREIAAACGARCRRRHREGRAARSQCDRQHAPPGTPPLNSLPLGTGPSVRCRSARASIRAGRYPRRLIHVLFPSVELSAGGDTNPQHIPGGASSLYFVAAPELQVQSDWSRHSSRPMFRALTPTTRAAISTVAQSPYFNSLIDGRIDVNRNTQICWKTAFWLPRKSRAIEFAAGLASLPIVTTTGGTLGIAETFNRLFVSLKGLFDRSAYQDSKLTDGEISSNGDRDLNQYAAVARVSRDRPGA